MSAHENGSPLRRTHPFLTSIVLCAALGMAQARGNVRSEFEGSRGGGDISVQLPTRDQVSPKVSVLVTLGAGDAKPASKVTLSVKAVIQPGWHISALGAPESGAFALPTTLDFEPKGLTPVGDAFVPSVEPQSSKVGDATYLQHSGVVTWTREYRVVEGAGGYSGKGSIRFQVCDENMCLPPKTLEFSLGTLPGGRDPQPSSALHGYQFIGEPIVVALHGVALERNLINNTALVTADPEKDLDLYIQQVMKSMDAKEALTMGGTVEVDGQQVAIYVPEQDEFPLRNTSEDETRYGNTSTFISIDHDGDGEIVDHESVATNRPIRLADSMFLVTGISKEPRTLTLQGVDTPLAGAVLNRKCPEFWYETVDGHVVSDRSILGTVTILDVWAVT